MKKSHYNCKPIRLELNGKSQYFPSRNTCIDYLNEIHGLCHRTVVTIIASGQPYKPRQHALKHLTGMKLYYI